MARRARNPGSKPTDPMRAAPDLVGLGGQASEINRAFALMSVAEQEIEDAARRHPDEMKAVWNAFRLLVPGELLRGLADGVYRHHCRELLDRVAAGEDTRPGTRAEVCAMISRMTQATRLDHDVEMLGLTITNEIFPGRDLLGDGWREFYPHAMREKEVEFRRKLAQEDRVMREELRDVPAHFLESLAS